MIRHQKPSDETLFNLFRVGPLAQEPGRKWLRFVDPRLDSHDLQSVDIMHLTISKRGFGYTKVRFLLSHIWF